MTARQEGLFVAELIWEGKYDKDGRRVAPLRVTLPFQTVETVNESVQQRQLSLERFESDSKYPLERSAHYDTTKAVRS